jgi:cyanophycin synthetase
MPYLYCYKQPSTVFTATVDLPSKTYINYIKHILVDCFEIDQPGDCLSLEQELELNEGTKQIISYIYSLARLFQQTVGIASFDKAHLLEVRPVKEGSKENRFEIKIALPHPENTPIGSIQQSLIYSIVVIEKIKASFPNDPLDLLGSIGQGEVEKKLGHKPFSQSTIPILESAYRQNISFIHHGSGIFQLGTGKFTRLLDRSSSDSDSAIGARVSQNKLLSQNILKKLGYPFPKSKAISSDKDAIDIFKKWGGHTVVIKPQNLDRGEGITLNIQTEEQVATGFKKAQSLSKLVMIEEMTPGTCHRIFVVGDKVLFVTKRNPKYLIGNGKDSIESLIKIENDKELNKAKFLRKIPLCIDADEINHLKTQELSPDCVPKENKRVYLRPTESTRWGGVAEDCSDKIHPENSKIALSIAKFLKLAVCGLDFMTTDISIPWYQNNGKFLEVNYSPYIAGKTQKSKKIIDEYINQLMSAKKHLHTNIFVGNQQAFINSYSHFEEEVKSGKKVAFISNQLTTDYLCHGQKNQISSLYNSWESTLGQPDLESIIITIQDDRLIKSGLPSNKINQITIINSDITTELKPEQQAKSFSKLIKLLEKFKSEDQ